MHTIARRIIAWYDVAERSLPWREPGTTPWGVYVSEIMAQQTQITRVAEAWVTWLARWPVPAALAAATPADVVRQWAGLGYPRRAVWMHTAATRMVALHGGEVPSTDAELRALPGVGEYTASAVRAFAYGQRVAVLDVNVRRVHARVFEGTAAPGPSITNAERSHHEAFLPSDAGEAARLSQAVMEFGALVCVAREPKCTTCPIVDACRWHASGMPAGSGSRRQPRFEGSDRQCRGALMRVLREASSPVPASMLEAAWADGLQRTRCLDGLVRDGLVEPLAAGRYALPG